MREVHLKREVQDLVLQGGARLLHGHKDVEIGVWGGLAAGVGAEELQGHETLAQEAANCSGERVKRSGVLWRQRPRCVHGVTVRRNGPSPVSRRISIRTHPILGPPRDPLFWLGAVTKYLGHFLQFRYGSF